MGNKIKKVQVVLAAIDQNSHSFNLLLLKTNEKRGSFWQNVTGKIEEGETFEEGALREAMEETALNTLNIVDIIHLGLSFEFTDQRGRKVHEESFMIILEDKWEVKIDPHEHESFQWVDKKDISSDILKYPSNFEALKKATNILSRWSS
jgi:8-oxo-dGTP pyrophosphatase MutT (NUDIX family)